MTKGQGLVLSVCVAIAGWLYTPEPAHACSYMRGPAVLQGYPVEGQVDVPTDVRPVFNSSAAWIDDFDTQSPVFELTTASGQSVAVTPRRSFIGGFEVIPDVALESQIGYTLTGRWTSLSTPPMEVSVSLSFTTGAGPVADPPPSVSASLQHYVFDAGPQSSCDSPRTGTCVSFPADVMVKFTHIDNIGQEWGDYLPDGELIGSLQRGPFFANLSGIDQGTPFECIKLSARAPNGTFGEPLMLCGQDAPSYGLTGSRVIACTSAGLTHDGRLASQLTTSDERRILTQGGGCALAGEPSAGAAPPTVALLLAGLGLVAARRRRRP